MKKYLALAALLVPSLSIAGTLTSMNQADVMNAFADKTITTIPAATLSGKVLKNSFTGYFSRDGKAQGLFETKPNADPQSDTGSWKVEADGMFCFKWDHWDGAQEKCVAIYKLSNAFLIVNKQDGFESLILSDQIKSGNQM